MIVYINGLVCFMINMIIEDGFYRCLMFINMSHVFENDFSLLKTKDLLLHLASGLHNERRTTDTFKLKT